MRYGVLCENHLYNKVFSARKKAGGKTVVVYYLKDLKANKLRKANPMKEKINRMGISFSKNNGGAVKRNRAKRIIREAYRQIENERPLKKGNLIVILAREGIDGAKMQDVKRDLFRSFERLELCLGRNSTKSWWKLPFFP